MIPLKGDDATVKSLTCIQVWNNLADIDPCRSLYDRNIAYA